MPMQKYQRPPKLKVKRSIPLRNPIAVQWFKYGHSDGKLDGKRPSPKSGPTEECFDADAKWYAIKNGKLVRVTGELEAKPQFIVIDRRDDDMELRLYFCGTQYFFVQIYYCIGKEFLSVTYRGRDAALRAYSAGDIRWSSSKPIVGKRE